MNLPPTMHAAIQRHEGYSGVAEGPQIDDAAEWLEWAELPLPVPADGQVLIKMRSASVNPSDLHFIKGEYGQPRRLGVPAGFEGCGDVVAAGEGALGNSLVGQRVAFAVSPNGSGAWADYALTDANTCVPLHPSVSDDDGAAQIVNPLTAVAMMDLASSHTDSIILTAATSQLCKLMLGLAKDKGIKVIAVVRRSEQTERLKELGATEVLVSSDDGFKQAAKAAMKEYKPRLMLDAVGGQISSDLFHAMPSHSRWVVYGKLDIAPPLLNEPGQLVFMNKQIEGFWLVNWMRDTSTDDKRRVFGDVQTRFSSGQWRTDVSTHLPLKDLVGGLAAATKLLDGKVMISY